MPLFDHEFLKKSSRYLSLGASRFGAVLLILSLLLSSTLWAAQLDHPTQQAALQFLERYELKVVSADREMNLSALGIALKDKKAVFVGEQHNRYDHHLNQLAILRLMYQHNPQLSIGVEWFQQSFQAAIDDYLAGDIDEAAMLRRSGYYERWGYDYRQLRPIMVYARDNKIPVVALNAPAEITREVSAKGLDALSLAERQQIPATIHPPQAAYRQYLREVFDRHMGGKGDFERFVLIQRIWDETMAANVVRQLQANPQHQMLVFAGSGHVGRGTAIPSDVARTFPVEQLATLHSVARAEIAAGAFDYFILSDELSLPPTGKLGVWLENKADDAGGTYVVAKKLAADSAAGEAGMLAGDRFISVAGQAVNSTADLLSVLANTRRGQPIAVEFLRTAGDERSMIKRIIKLR